MDKFYISNGKISYNKDGSVIIYVHPSIIFYYKFWIEKFIGKKISTSYHRPHITILLSKREGNLIKHPNWTKHHNKTVQFKYYSKIYTDNEWFFLGQYFWLRVECPIIYQIRSELGLKPNSGLSPHCTIGFRGY